MFVLNHMPRKLYVHVRSQSYAKKVVHNVRSHSYAKKVVRTCSFSLDSIQIYFRKDAKYMIFAKFSLFMLWSDVKYIIFAKFSLFMLWRDVTVPL